MVVVVIMMVMMMVMMAAIAIASAKDLLCPNGLFPVSKGKLSQKAPGKCSFSMALAKTESHVCSQLQGGLEMIPGKEGCDRSPSLDVL